MGLLVFNFPVGFIYIVTFDNGAVCSEKVLNLIVGGISMIVVLGGLSLLVRFIFKRRNHPEANKWALIIYTILTFGMLALAMPGFNAALDRMCGVPV